MIKAYVAGLFFSGLDRTKLEEIGSRVKRLRIRIYRPIGMEEIPIVGLETDFHRQSRTLNNMVWGACEGGLLAFDFEHLLRLIKVASGEKGLQT